jgi:CobQ-like glutamine amidotransferase family enzyme
MIVEVLYPRVAQLFGDQGNVDYLKLCLPQAHFRYCDLQSTPYFAHHKVDLVVLGSCTENMQRLIVQHLSPYRERLERMIEDGVFFLVTGSGFDVFGKKIIDEDKKEFSALGLFDYHIVQDRMHRFNSFVLAKHKGIEMVGFKSQFTRVYPKSTLPSFMKMIRGEGYNPDVAYEGLHRNNFYATQTLGPLLVLNPLFTTNLLKQMGLRNMKLPHHDALMHAYQKRLQELSSPNMKDYP